MRAPQDPGSLSPRCTRCLLFLNYASPGCLRGLPADTSSDQPVTHVCHPVPFTESIPHGTRVDLQPLEQHGVVSWLWGWGLGHVPLCAPSAGPQLRSPLLDDVVELVVGLVVLQTLHRVPLTLPIGLPQLPDEHLGEEETADAGQGLLDSPSVGEGCSALGGLPRLPEANHCCLQAPSAPSATSTEQRTQPSLPQC